MQNTKTNQQDADPLEAKYTNTATGTNSNHIAGKQTVNMRTPDEVYLT